MATLKNISFPTTAKESNAFKLTHLSIPVVDRSLKRGSVHAISLPYTLYRIRVITSSGTPLEAASIELVNQVEKELLGVTDSNGRYDIAVKAGTLLVTAFGFEAKEVNYDFIGQEDEELTIVFSSVLEVFESNGIHFTVNDAVRLNNTLYQNEQSGYLEKLCYHQPVPYEGVNRVQVNTPDSGQQLTLEFKSLDNTLITTLPIENQNGYYSVEWQWSDIVAVTSKIKLLITDANEELAISEPICFEDEESLLKLEYRHKTDRRQLGIYQGNQYKHILYIAASVVQDEETTLEEFEDSEGNLYQLQTSFKPFLNIVTEAMPPYLIAMFNLAILHSDLTINDQPVTRQGVAEKLLIEGTDLFTLSQKFRLTNKTIKINF